MPTVIIEGYKFRFYSSDINEPPHFHVIRGGNEAKIWLQPSSWNIIVVTINPN